MSSPESGRNSVPLRRRITLPSAVLRGYFTEASQQLLVDHNRLAKQLGTHTPTEKLLKQPVAREMTLNEGAVTYLVHSTRSEHAERVMQEGLKLGKAADDPLDLSLAFTTKMMPAIHEPGAVKRINHGITYRYSGPHNNAKLVIKVNEENPGTSLQKNPYAEGFLAQPDGENIIATGDPQSPYAIPAERVMGYFNLDTGDFVANPQFVEKPE